MIPESESFLIALVLVCATGGAHWSLVLFCYAWALQFVGVSHG